MSRTNCAAINCSTAYYKKEPNIRLFRFPKDPEQFVTITDQLEKMSCMRSAAHIGYTVYN